MSKNKRNKGISEKDRESWRIEIQKRLEDIEEDEPEPSKDAPMGKEGDDIDRLRSRLAGRYPYTIVKADRYHGDSPSVIVTTEELTNIEIGYTDGMQWEVKGELLGGEIEFVAEDMQDVTGELDERLARLDMLDDFLKLKRVN